MRICPSQETSFLLEARKPAFGVTLVPRFPYPNTGLDGLGGDAETRPLAHRCQFEFSETEF